MLFSSLVFLFTFLPITLLVYYLVPRKVKNVVLLIASLIFYAWGEPVYIFLMLISILFNYFCGMDIALKAGRKSQVRSLIFTIVVNLFILGFFKYYGFIVTNLNAILPFYIPYRKLELPIGISFYTFQTLSYIIDVYRGNVDVQVNLIDFGTYVTMFPQLIAGPIVQYADVERQLRERKESLTKFGYGAWFFVMGLAKKVLLANTIGSIYENIAVMDGMSVVTAWLGCLAYTFQIYFDFSGYSDMAVGLGKMFGFEFMQNFNYPYISKSVTEFWRRWHITLGTWMKDYIFYPMSLSKKMNRFGKWAKKHMGNTIGRTLPICFANIVIFFIVGIWHGAAWKFIAYGLYNGFIIAISNLLEPVYKKLLNKFHINAASKGWTVWQIIRTFILVNIGWYFDMAESMRQAFQMMKWSVVGICASQFKSEAILSLGIEARDYVIIIAGCIIVFIVSVLKEKGIAIRESIASKPLVIRWAFYYVLVAVILIFGYIGATQGFIYANF